MKKIIPFNNVLQFNTDVREITAISLEHEIKKYPDAISGVFYISGEYKITDGQLEKEKFNFELPFDIALSSNYDLDSLLVDIDDFRYELISDKKLKVNIDLYIDGNVIETPPQVNDYQEELNRELPKDVKDTKDDLNNDLLSETSKEEKSSLKEEKKIEPIVKKEDKEEKDNQKITEKVDIKSTELPSSGNEEVKETETLSTEKIEPERIDLLKDMLTTNKEDNMKEGLNLNINNNNDTENENITENINNNIFEPNQEEEKYVTYRVYKVLDNDTIDSILAKYNITKEMLADYNDIENITPGDKLIIPTNEK